jgi:hypothetical protein
MTAPVEALHISVHASPEGNDDEARLPSDTGDLLSRFAQPVIGLDPGNGGRLTGTADG